MGGRPAAAGLHSRRAGRCSPHCQSWGGTAEAAGETTELAPQQQQQVFGPDAPLKWAPCFACRRRRRGHRHHCRSCWVARGALAALPAMAAWAPPPAAAAAAGAHRPACRRWQRVARQPHRAMACRHCHCCCCLQEGRRIVTTCCPRWHAPAACALASHPGRPQVTWRRRCSTRGGGCRHARCHTSHLPLPLGCSRSARRRCDPGCAAAPAAAAPQWPALGWAAAAAAVFHDGPDRHRLQGRALPYIASTCEMAWRGRGNSDRARELITGTSWGCLSCLGSPRGGKLDTKEAITTACKRYAAIEQRVRPATHASSGRHLLAGISMAN